MKRLLLDTHAVLWWWGDSPRLSGAAKRAIAKADLIYVSAASAWEIATKWRLGKLHDIDDPAVRVPLLLERDGFQALPVAIGHALRAGLLDNAHRDPFDRLIAAQAMAEDLQVVTCDPHMREFGCEVLW